MSWGDDLVAKHPSALAEEPGWVPSTRMVPSSVHPGLLHRLGAHTYTQTKHLYKCKVNACHCTMERLCGDCALGHRREGAWLTSLLPSSPCLLLGQVTSCVFLAFSNLTCDMRVVLLLRPVVDQIRRVYEDWGPFCSLVMNKT